MTSTSPSHSGSLLLFVVLAASATGLAEAPEVGEHQTVVAPEALRWKELRPGAEIAVVSGDPDKTGSPFVLRVRYHGKSRIPPHWHPIAEHLTVLSGTFRLGMGTNGDESAATALAAGAYALVASKMVHYAWADGATTVQVHGIGPFVINYINPADDPKNAAKK